MLPSLDDDALSPVIDATRRDGEAPPASVGATEHRGRSLEIRAQMLDSHHIWIDDAFVKKASVIHYYYNGKWLRLAGAD